MKPSTRRAKILVIDDIPDFLQEVSGILAPEFRVSTCACPLAAVGKYGMPDTDAYRFGAHKLVAAILDSSR